MFNLTPDEIEEASRILAFLLRGQATAQSELDAAPKPIQDAVLAAYARAVADDDEITEK
ncbi:hypothetical protein IAD21_00710 [Abditibacteriota bacterium]|nr:hypothetical protein IAD21_00710 [Abditibacteriota bacterium]